MKSVSGKTFAKALERNGWQLSRINGSHHIYTKSGRTERVSLPLHGNRDLKIGLLKHLISLTGIPPEEL